MDRPWNEDGAPVNPKRLSSILAPYGIQPHSIKLPAGKVARGFYRHEFEEIFSRYQPRLLPRAS